MINLEDSKIIVVKIGVTQLFDARSGVINMSWLSSLVEDIDVYQQQGLRFVLVVSGSYGIGSFQDTINYTKMKLQEKQCYSVIGNHELMKLYENLFSKINSKIVPAYITIEDIENRKRFASAKSILSELIQKSYIPIVTENDLVTAAELRFGDSDRLAAKVAHLVNAELLVLFSRVDGLYSEDPNINSEASFFKEIYEITLDVERVAGDSSMGSGGMSAKVAAAKIAINSGINCVIMREGISNPLSKLDIGFKATWFYHSAAGNKKFVKV